MRAVPLLVRTSSEDRAAETPELKNSQVADAEWKQREQCKSIKVGEAAVWGSQWASPGNARPVVAASPREEHC